MAKQHIVQHALIGVLTLLVLACGKDKEGCMETNALNFDPEATIENGSCEFSPEVFLGLEFGSIIDQEGNQYATFVIGDQEWMAENLRTTSYANGDPIPNVTDQSQWSNLTTGAWAHYNNDSQYENPYGKLYNWYTVNDSRNVCPTGWHVPSDAEWSTLVNYLDPNANGGFNFPNTAGGKMKSVGIQFWESPNTDATNESGFSGLPGGARNNGGVFYGSGFLGSWWSSTAGTEVVLGNVILDIAWILELNYSGGDVYRSSFSQAGGLSVRCLKD